MDSKLLKTIFMFLSGFCIYITIEVCFRGYSYPLMGCCGGLMLVLLDKINDKISYDMDLIIQGCIGSGIVTMMELVIGETLKYIGVSPMWDYSSLPLNYDGVICLPFSLIWIVVSIVGIMIADAINYYIFEELPVPYYKICGKVIIRFKEKHCKF